MKGSGLKKKLAGMLALTLMMSTGAPAVGQELTAGEVEDGQELIVGAVENGQELTVGAVEDGQNLIAGAEEEAEEFSVIPEEPEAIEESTDIPDTAVDEEDPEAGEIAEAGLIEDPEDGLVLQAQGDFSGYFAETYSVETVAYTDGLVLTAPWDAEAYQWYDLYGQITVVENDYEEETGMNSISDDETIIDGETGKDFSVVLQPDEPMHYYGCVSDEGDSVIFQVFREQNYMGAASYIDAGLGDEEDTAIYPQIYYYGEAHEPSWASYYLCPTVTGFYRFTSVDGNADGEDLNYIYSDPMAYLYDYEDPGEDDRPGELLKTCDTGGDGYNYSFTVELEAGHRYILETGQYDFRGDIGDYYNGTFGTYPVLISRVDGPSFPNTFPGSWNVQGLVYTSGLELPAPAESSAYQWYDLGTEITTLYDGDDEIGYDSVSDDTTAIGNSDQYLYPITWQAGEMAHYYGCVTMDGDSIIYQVIDDFMKYLTIPVSGNCVLDRKSLTVLNNGSPTTIRFNLKPTVNGKVIITSLNPYADVEQYTDPYITVRDSSGSLVAYNDDGGIGYNFNVSFNVTANKSYILDTGYAERDWELYGSYPYRIIFISTETINISKKPSSVKAKSTGKGKVTITWKKFRQTKKTKPLWKRIKKVQVQYSTNKDFTVTEGADRFTVTIPKGKTKLIIKKLRPKTVYYFRVRYWDGQNGCSEWSAVKKVKTK